MYLPKIEMCRLHIEQSCPLLKIYGTTPPFVLMGVNDIMCMEEMLALDNDTYEKCKALWLIWIDFSTSDSLKAMLTPYGQLGNTS